MYVEMADIHKFVIGSKASHFFNFFSMRVEAVQLHKCMSTRPLNRGDSSKQ